MAKNRVKTILIDNATLDKIAPYAYFTSVKSHYADVAELADALDSGSSVLTDVEVRILSSALYENRGFWSNGWKPLLRYQKKNTRKTPSLAKSPFSTGSFDELIATIRAEIKLPFSVKQKSTFTIWALNVCRFTE